MDTASTFMGLKKQTLFQIFKYSVYIIVCGNSLYFLIEDLNASAHTFRDGVGFAEYINAFTASTDTITWVILLLAFELETYVIPDEKFTPTVQWSLNGLSLVCYTVIVMAFTGYWEKASMIYGFDSVEPTNACTLVGSVESVGIVLDEYETLSKENCATFTGSLHVNPDVSMVSTDAGLTHMKRQAVLDVVNSATWIIVVFVLALDVFLQTRGLLSDRIYTASKRFKYVLYSILIACAVYWAIIADIMGTWDALVWILAFFFIELNVQQWHDEEAEEYAGTGDTA